MANITTNLSVTAPTHGLSGVLSSMKDRLERYALYRRTLNELRDLRDAELSDIGLNRSMIKRVAIEAAYGTNG